MKFEKIDYCIYGRFENGRKYGICTREKVTGYTAAELNGIAIRKRAGWWYVDHIKTGFAIVTTGSKTRDAAVKEYFDHWAEKVNNITEKAIENMIETAAAAPLESDVASWETITFTTLYDWRLDKIKTAAGNAGLIIQNADKNKYLHGGSIKIIGDPEKLETVKTIIAKQEKAAQETAAWEAAQEAATESEKEKECTALVIVRPAALATTAAYETETKTETKAARGPVPEKTFINTEIIGNGWKIFFDGENERTRVIFDKIPCAGIREIVKAAGFYWSPKMKSWNKKLTFKAYRAALKLEKELREYKKSA